MSKKEDALLDEISRLYKENARLRLECAYLLEDRPVRPVDLGPRSPRIIDAGE